MDEKAEPSVWQVASLAVFVLVGIMLVAGMLGSNDSSAVAASKMTVTTQ